MKLPREKLQGIDHGSKPAFATIGILLTRFLVSAANIVAALAVVIGSAWIFMAQPFAGLFAATTEAGEKGMITVNKDRLKEIVYTITEDFTPRNWKEIENLDKCAEYIGNHFIKAGANIEFQEYEAQGNVYRNVIARFQLKPSDPANDILIIGAHYDAFRNTPGADDNTSAIAGLIEIAYLIGDALREGQQNISKNVSNIMLVAYTMEEPPFFTTPDMGSAVHAKRFVDSGNTAKGVIVLEMIGYFDDTPGSQKYPMPMMRLFYPNRGNFIAVVGRSDQGRWISHVKRHMKGATDLPVYSLRAPAIVSGVDFSDHRSYWPYGIPAVMITDTAFYRNPNYHTPSDTADTLDYKRMCKVIEGVYAVIIGFLK